MRLLCLVLLLGCHADSRGRRDQPDSTPTATGETSSTCDMTCAPVTKLAFPFDGRGTVVFPAGYGVSVEADLAMPVALVSPHCSCCGSRIVDSACSVTVVGQVVTLDAFLDLELYQNGNVCWTCSCVADTNVQCDVPPLPAGAYTLVFGSEEREFVVPGPAVRFGL